MTAGLTPQPVPTDTAPGHPDRRRVLVALHTI